MSLEEKLDEAGVGVAQPGDRLIVTFNHPITSQTVHLFRERLAALAPDLTALFIEDVQSVTIQRVEDR
jgi:hypothetical protein